MAVPGWRGEHVNVLRLWSARPAQLLDLDRFNRGKFLEAAERRVVAETISRILYPNDSTPEGQELRLKQEYFFTSASLQDLVRRFAYEHGDLASLGKQVAMHVAAAKPLALSADQLDKTAIDRERAIYAEQAAASGKPAEIVAKMVEGRLRKYYEEVVLLEQAYVHDDKVRVKQAVEQAAKELGAPVKVAGFERFALGEGIDKGAGDAA